LAAIHLQGVAKGAMANSRKIDLTPDGILPEREQSQAPQAADVSHREDAGPSLPTLPLEAHRKDQERRKKARRDLEEALESYFATLTRFEDIELTKMAEIVGAYACEIYDSSAEGYLAIPSLDPEALFGMAGPLNVGLTLTDVEKCVSTLRVRRPWKISSDPFVRLLDDGRELIGLHYEHPWFRLEIGNIVARRFQDTRKAYSQITTAQREKSEAPEGGTKSAQPATVSNSKDQGRKRGPKPDYETAARVAEVVAHVAPDGDWRGKLDDVCEALDEKNIACPKTWRRKDRTCRRWSDYPERSHAVKAIQYRLALAKQRKNTTPETFS